jgi:hypothetical protein
MTRTSGSRSATKQAQAQILRALETTWRNWRAFIAEKKDELTQRLADESGLDDLTTPLNSTPALRKAKFNATTRQELAMILEQRRQAAQRDGEAAARTAGATPPDVEQVVERLIVRIDDELNGRILTNGNALVWFEGQLIEFDYRTVSSGTTDDDYLAMGGGDPVAERKRRTIILLIASAFFIGAALLAFNVFGGKSETATVGGPTLGSVAAQSAPLWDIQSLAVGGASDRVIGAALGYPMLICLTEQQQQALKPGETVVVTGTTSVRSYMLHDSTTAAPRDLIVADCSQKPPKLLASAALRSAVTTRSRAEGLISLVTTTGSDTDPATIPADRMRVDLTVAQLDAPQGTLILADGTRWSPAASAAAGKSTVLTYLVPVAPSTQTAGWEVSGANDLPTRLTLAIPAPQARAALLREKVTVSATGADVSMRNGSPILTLSLTIRLAQTAAPITLLATDLMLKRSGSDRAAEWQPPTLLSGKTVTIRVVIPLQDAESSMEAAFGAWHARLRW